MAQAVQRAKISGKVDRLSDPEETMSGIGHLIEGLAGQVKYLPTRLGNIMLK